MCTIQGIKDAIRETYQSQYDMESADIDRLPPPKRLTRFHKDS